MINEPNSFLLETNLAAIADDGIARILDPGSGKVLIEFPHPFDLKSVAFSPDEKYLAVGGINGNVHIWDIDKEEEIGRLPHQGKVNSLEFSPDGSYLLTGCADKTARLWLWKPQDLVKEGCRRLTRNFSEAVWRQYFGEEDYRKTCDNLP